MLVFSVALPVAFLGAVSPEYLQVDITQKATGVDLSSDSFTGCYVLVRKADGSRVQWEGTISDQTPTGFTFRHMYEDGDLSVVGPYAVQAVMTGPQGPRRCVPATLSVEDPFDFRG